jgi:uncharacterized RDD family membrane protein YckC
MRYNTVFRRILAFIIDAALFQAATFIVVMMGREVDEIWWIALSFIYTIVLHALYGATVGKWMVRIRVMDLSEQRIPTLYQALLREAGYLTLLIASLLLPASLLGQLPWSWLHLWSMPLLAIADLVVALADQKSRSIHDHLATSVVVRVSQPSQGAR